MKSDHRRLLERIDGLAGKTEQQAIRQVARAAATPPSVDLEGPLNQALLKTAEGFTSLLSQTFQAVAWNRDVLYDETSFRQTYVTVAKLTKGFTRVDPRALADILAAFPRAILVFRLIASLSLDEISTLLHTSHGIALSKDVMRDFELGREVGKSQAAKWAQASRALALLFSQSIGGNLLQLPDTVDKQYFKERKDKPDTRRGWRSVAETASHGVDYWLLLYQRYVGGFFRQAMDASSSIKGDILEEAIVGLLQSNRIPFHRTRPRERIEGWKQAPDFLLPSRKGPAVVIEAKLAEDGGTARDKAARIERLCREALAKRVFPIAVIDGKGFYRINDVTAPILRNTRGETYTLKTLARLIEIPAVSALRLKR